jgi:type IX secretion system PorP/SprF family membrane protein
MKKLYITIIAVVISFTAKSQSDALLSHYMFNGLFLNPGYAGSHEYASATAIHRNQWAGFDGSPKTNVISFDTPIRSKTMGLGITFINDRIGGYKRNDILLNYAYHIKLNQNVKLGLGILGGMANLAYSPGFAWDGADNLLQKSNFWSPKVGIGAYLYSKKYYAGLSMPTVYAQEPSKFSTTADNKFNFFKRHVTLTGGYLFDATESIVLKPSFLMKYQKSAPMQFDINCNAYWNNIFGIGASYRIDRTGNTVIGLLEINPTPELRIGYSYDYSFTKLQRFSNGSHEIMIGFDFGSRTAKIKNPRYF